MIILGRIQHHSALIKHISKHVQFILVQLGFHLDLQLDYYTLRVSVHQQHLDTILVIRVEAVHLQRGVNISII